MATIDAAVVAPGTLTAMAPLLGAATLHTSEGDYVLLAGVLGVTCFRRQPASAWELLWVTHLPPATWGGSGADRLYGISTLGGRLGIWGYNASLEDLWTVFSTSLLTDADVQTPESLAAALDDVIRLPPAFYTSVTETDNDPDGDAVDFLTPVLRFRSRDEAYLAFTSGIIRFPDIDRRRGDWSIWAAQVDSPYAEDASVVLEGSGVFADLVFDGASPVVQRRLSIDRGGRAGTRLDVLDTTFRAVAFQRTYDNTRIRLSVVPSRTISSEPIHLGRARTAPEDV